MSGVSNIPAIIIPGHGVASGIGEDPRYPDGTLAMQVPHFDQRGLDLSTFYQGTLNLDISPYHFTVEKPSYFFDQVPWSPFIPPENFYFFEASVQYRDVGYDGFVYLPDPATKTDHIQPTCMLEVLLPKIPDIFYGEKVVLQVDERLLRFYREQ